MRLAPRALLALPVSAALLVAGAASAAAPKLGPNLAPNPSFEQSSFDPATQNQLPVTPVGWTFEGAGYPDYNQRGGHTGARSVQISLSLAGSKQICDHSVDGSERCAANPAAGELRAIDSGTAPRYSARPAWVNSAAIPVAAGKRYRFSVWAIRPSLAADSGPMGEGAATRVRWVDAAGKGISVSDAASLVRGPRRTLGFKLISADLRAPAGASGAFLLLGHSDYIHTGANVAFDDVSFQQVG
ncbi:MAG: hypothetical protein NVSMB55_14830 [Mycobacteriales bacterium]